MPSPWPGSPATELSASTALRLLRTLENSGFLAHTRTASTARPSAGPARRAGVEPRVLDPFGGTGLAATGGGHGGDRPIFRCADTTAPAATMPCTWPSRRAPIPSATPRRWVEACRWRAPASAWFLPGRPPNSGYAVSDRGVEEDVTAIAAPLRQPGTPGAIDHTGPVAAISVVAPSYRMTLEGIERIGGLVAAEARALFGAGPANPSARPILPQHTTNSNHHSPPSSKQQEQ